MWPISFFRKKIKTSKSINLPAVSLVAMASTNIDATIESLLFSSREINYHEVILISHELPKNLPKKIIFKKIDRIESYEMYNFHVTFSLKNYINSSHALLVQHDGFVIDASKWNDAFLNYDYIGAPWPLPKDSFSYRDDAGRIVRVGNGGFSLRSKRLLELPGQLDLVWEPFHGYFHEDGFICCKNRSLLEANLIKFAPVEIAQHFSYESKIHDLPQKETFGVHGVHNLKKNQDIIKRYISTIS